MKFAIQTLFGYGWDYVGSDDKGERSLFNTMPEAQSEVDEVVNAMGYDANEWRAVPYDETKDTKSDL